MPSPFFPGPEFGWTFVGVFAAVLAAAAWIDLRTLLIPKPVTLGLAGLGLVANIARGAWVGAGGHPGWAFGPNGGPVGAADGLLFATAGLAAGFALFMVQFVVGVCGGADVKLGAAIGAWLGPIGVLVALAFSLFFVVVIGIGRVAVRLLGGTTPRPTTAADLDPARPGWRRHRRASSYSLPMALGALLALVGMYAPELGLRGQPRPAAPAGR